MTLLDQISDALGASGALGDLAGTLGASPSDTESLVGAGLPALLGGLGSQASGDGLSSLMGLLGDSGGFVDSIGSFFGQGDKTGMASKLVGSILGGQRGGIESAVAAATGGDMSVVSRFLPMLAPAVMGLLGKITGDDDLDADAVAAELGGMAADGPHSELFGATTDEDRQGFVDGIASLREAGGLASLIPAQAASAAVVPAAAGGASTAAIHSLAAPDDADRNGMGWIPSVMLPIMVLIAGLVLWQCTSDANDPAPVVEVETEVEAEPAVTIASLAAGTPDLSTLVGLATDLDLVGTLGDPDAGPFTVFAPTDDAFATAGGLLAELDSDQVATAVTYHVVPGIYTAADLTPGATLETLAGEELIIGSGVVLPGGVMVTTADIEADNGIVHIVDGVLVPQSVLDALAPEPDPTPEPTAEPTPEPEPEPVVTIADLAIGNPDLSTLTALAVQLDLAGQLSDPDAGPFTVFAPTNAAFEAAGGVLDRLDEAQTTTAVTFHVVPGIVTSDDLVPGATFETLAGETLTVQDDGTLSGGIQVVTADLTAANGVVHVVDNVLVPGSIQRSLASEDVNALFELEPIQFATASADILPESVATLDQAIVTLTSLPTGTVFEVQGHTDSDGSLENNQILSEQRAASVVAYLTAGGVDADMLVPVGYGETQLKIEPEVAPSDFAANRRIEFLDISGQ